MAKKRDRAFWESARHNNFTYIQYFNRLVELGIAMFDWKNLPDTVDERYLELALFRDGKAVFFKDEELGYLGLRCMAAGTWDVYQVPRIRRAYSPNGYNRELDETNSVIIFNNQLRTNSFLDVEMFAERLYNLDRTIDVNCNAQKTPILITCDENEKLTLKNLYMDYQGNEPIIYGYKSVNPNSLQAISTGAPFVSDKLYTLKVQYWNEALTYLGISNVNFQKKERMVSDEVMRSMGGVIANRYSRLNARRKACEQINELFGLDIWCDYRDDFREMDDEFMIDSDTESKEASLGDIIVNKMVEDIRSKETVG